MKAIFLDRDGVLNYKPVRARYVRNWDEFEWKPGAIEAVVQLKRAGYTVLVISNQAGVGRGHMTEDDLNDIHHHMQKDLRAHGVQIDRFYCCVHTPDAGCDCRKPGIGLLLRAQEDFQLDISQIPFIGDDDKDVLAGKTAGCPVHRVYPRRSVLTVVNEEILRHEAPSVQEASA